MKLSQIKTFRLMSKNKKVYEKPRRLESWTWVDVDTYWDEKLKITYQVDLSQPRFRSGKDGEVPGEWMPLTPEELDDFGRPMKTVTMSLEEFKKYEDYERAMTKLESTNNKHYSQGVSDAVIFLKEYLISKRNNPYSIDGDENYKKVLDLAKEIEKDHFRKWKFTERVLSRNRV